MNKGKFPSRVIVSTLTVIKFFNSTDFGFIYFL